MSEKHKTLGDYRRLCVALASEDCAAVRFLDDKIAREGSTEPVLADESQMLALLAPMMLRENDA